MSLADPWCWDEHPGVTCNAVAPGSSCAPKRCYCGACPWYQPLPPPRPVRLPKKMRLRPEDVIMDAED